MRSTISRRSLTGASRRQRGISLLEALVGFLIGVVLVDFELVTDAPVARELCGTCERCIPACPTGAIVAPYELDARRCISYLTIEHDGPIPEDLRPLLGNRIYGCDDCQLACPWNRFARPAAERDFAEVRNGLDASALATLLPAPAGPFRAAGRRIRSQKRKNL